MRDIEVEKTLKRSRIESEITEENLQISQK